MKTITYNENEIIFEEGTFGKAMYDVVEGKVGIYSKYKTGKEKLIAELGADEIFGEMGMLEFYPRSATAVALKPDTVIAEIPGDDLASYLSGKPDKLLKVLRLLSRRTRETDEKYLEACRIVYESDQAEKKGVARSAKLDEELQRVAREYGELNTLWLD